MKRLAGLLAIVAANAGAQCVMCFRTAAAQQEARARVLNEGIIILLIPPIAILTFFVVLAYRRRTSWGQVVATSSPEQTEEVQTTH
jgi:hypothetical protein